MTHRNSTGLLLTAALSLLAGPAVALDGTSAVRTGSDRIEEIPAAPSNTEQQPANFSLLNEMQRLREEVRTLRGELENEAHTVDVLQKRQQKWQGEIDKRIRALESTNGTSAEPAPAKDEAALPVSPDKAVKPDDEAKGNAAASPSPAPKTEGGDNPPVAASGGNEQDTYDDAFNLLKLGRYDESIAGFNTFLSQFPESHYADSAKYWLGETYYVKRQYEPVIAAYERLAKDHPTSQRITQALLKIGYSYHELGQTDKAVETLEGLRQRYPSSTAARLAEERLRRIKLERQ